MVELVRSGGRASDGHQVDAQISGFREHPQIAYVAREHVVAIHSERHDGCVHHVLGPGSAKQEADATTLRSVKGHDLRHRQRLGDGNLPPGPAPPDLRNDSAGCPRRPAVQPLALERRHQLAVAPFQREERSRVEHERHAAPLRGRPPTVVARRRIARCTSSISSSVISPCSDS